MAASGGVSTYTLSSSSSTHKQKNAFDFRATSMALTSTVISPTKKVENKCLKNWTKNKESKLLNRMDVQEKYASYTFLSKLNSIYKDRGLNLHENYKNRVTRDVQESQAETHNSNEYRETPIRICYNETPTEYMDPKIRDVIESNKFHQNRKMYAKEEKAMKKSKKKRVSFEEEEKEKKKEEKMIVIDRKQRFDCSSQCDFDMIGFIDDTAANYCHKSASTFNSYIENSFTNHQKSKSNSNRKNLLNENKTSNHSDTISIKSEKFNENRDDTNSNICRKPEQSSSINSKTLDINRPPPKTYTNIQLNRTDITAAEPLKTTQQDSHTTDQKYNSFQNDSNFSFQKTNGFMNHFKWNSNHFTEYKGENDHTQGIIGTIPDVDGKMIGGKNTVLDKVLVYSQCGSKSEGPCVTVVTNAGKIPRLSSRQFQPIQNDRDDTKQAVYTIASSNKNIDQLCTNFANTIKHAKMDDRSLKPKEYEKNNNINCTKDILNGSSSDTNITIINDNKSNKENDSRIKEIDNSIKEKENSIKISDNRVKENNNRSRENDNGIKKKDKSIKKNDNDIKKNYNSITSNDYNNSSNHNQSCSNSSSMTLINNERNSSKNMIDNIDNDCRDNIFNGSKISNFSNTITNESKISKGSNTITNTSSSNSNNDNNCYISNNKNGNNESNEQRNNITKNNNSKYKSSEDIINRSKSITINKNNNNSSYSKINLNVENSKEIKPIENTNDINKLIESYNKNDLERDNMNEQYHIVKQVMPTKELAGSNNQKAANNPAISNDVLKQDIIYISKNETNDKPENSKVEEVSNKIDIDKLNDDYIVNTIDNHKNKRQDRTPRALTNDRGEQMDLSSFTITESGYEIDLNEGQRKLYIDNRYARKSLRLKQDICHGEMTDIHRKEYLQHLGDKLKNSLNNNNKNNHKSRRNRTKTTALDIKCEDNSSSSKNENTVKDKETVSKSNTGTCSTTSGVLKTQDINIITGSSVKSKIKEEKADDSAIIEPISSTLDRNSCIKKFTKPLPNDVDYLKKVNLQIESDFERNLTILSSNRAKTTSDSFSTKRTQSVSFADEAEEIIDKPDYFVSSEAEEDFQKFYERDKLEISDLSTTNELDVNEIESEASISHDDVSLSQTNLHDVINEHGSKVLEEKLNVLKAEEEEETRIEELKEGGFIEEELFEEVRIESYAKAANSEQKDVEILETMYSSVGVVRVNSFIEMDDNNKNEKERTENEVKINIKEVEESTSSETPPPMNEDDTSSYKSTSITKITDRTFFGNDQTCIYSTVTTSCASSSYIPYKNVKTEITSDFRNEDSTSDFLSDITNEGKVDSSTDNESTQHPDEENKVEVKIDETNSNHEVIRYHNMGNPYGTKCSLENYKIDIGSIENDSIVENQCRESKQNIKDEIETKVESNIETVTISKETVENASVDSSENETSFWRFNEAANVNELVVIKQKNMNVHKPQESKNLYRDDTSNTSSIKQNSLKLGKKFNNFPQEILIPANTEPKVTFILQGHGKPSEKTSSETDADELSYVSLNSASMSRESPLFSPMTRRVQLKEKTNLDKLNFSKISAKVRRSRYGSNSNSVSNISNESVDGASLYATRVDTYVLMSDGLSHLSSGSYATHPPLNSKPSDPDDDQKTTVTLSKKWSGGLVATHESTNHIYNYHVEVKPEQISESGKKLHKIIFRNTIPIQEIKATNTHKTEVENINKNVEKTTIIEQPSTVVQVETLNDRPSSSKEGYELSKRLESPIHSLNPESIQLSESLYNGDINSIEQDNRYFSAQNASQGRLSLTSNNSIEGAIIHSTYDLNDSLDGTPLPNDIIWNMDQKLYPSNPEGICSKDHQMNSLTPQSRRDPRRIPEGTFQRSMRRITQVLNSDNLSPLSHLISIIWKDEGRKVRMEFLRYMLQINDVINDILDNIPKNIFPFKIKPLSIDRDFELTNKNSINLYLLIEDFNQTNIEIDFESNELLLSNVYLNENRIEEMKFCSQKLLNKEKWVLSPKLLIEYFSQSIDNYNRCIYQKKLSNVKKISSLHSFVDFEQVRSTCVKLNIHFPRKDIAFEVTLLLAIDIKDLSNKNHDVDSLCAPLKTTLDCSGFHLLAQPLLDKWEVSFLKARKFLFSTFDKESVATSILLALQYINEETLGKEGCPNLLPVHFYMLIFWTQSSTYKTERAWNEKNVAYHFLHVVNALKQCLVDRQCIDFFWPKINYFDRIPETCLRKISINLNEFIADLEIYVRSGGKQMRQGIV